MTTAAPDRLPTLLHYWRSSASWRVRWALAHKGIAFRHETVDLLQREQRGDAYRAQNPIGHVPTLVLPDGRRLSESVAILEFLEETHPSPPLYPTDPWQRACVRQLVEVVNAGIQPLQNLIVLDRHAEDPASRTEWAAFFNARGLAALEALCLRFDAELGKRGRFAFGDTLTAADLFLVPQVYSARRFGVDLTPFPRIVEAETAALETPHAEGARPE